MASAAGIIAAPEASAEYPSTFCQMNCCRRRSGHQGAEHQDAGAGGDPEHAPSRDMEVEQWRRRSPSPDNERRSGQDLEEQQTGCDRAGAGNRSEVDRQHQGRDQHDRQHHRDCRPRRWFR
jgi:hypothetical protein